MLPEQPLLFLPLGVRNINSGSKQTRRRGILEENEEGGLSLRGFHVTGLLFIFPPKHRKQRGADNWKTLPAGRPAGQPCPGRWRHQKRLQVSE